LIVFAINVPLAATVTRYQTFRSLLPLHEGIGSVFAVVASAVFRRVTLKSPKYGGETCIALAQSSFAGRCTS